MLTQKTCARQHMHTSQTPFLYEISNFIAYNENEKMKFEVWHEAKPICSHFTWSGWCHFRDVTSEVPIGSGNLITFHHFTGLLTGHWFGLQAYAFAAVWDWEHNSFAFWKLGVRFTHSNLRGFSWFFSNITVWCIACAGYRTKGWLASAIEQLQLQLHLSLHHQGYKTKCWTIDSPI